MKKHYIVSAGYMQDAQTWQDVKFYPIARTTSERDACTLLVAFGIVPDYKIFGEVPADKFFNNPDTYLGHSQKGQPGYKIRLSIELQQE